MRRARSPKCAPPAEAAGVDDLVKPIEERPPVARDTDPEVAGLRRAHRAVHPGDRDAASGGRARLAASRDRSVPVVADEPSTSTRCLRSSPSPDARLPESWTRCSPPASQQVPTVLPPPVAGQHATVDGVRPVTGAAGGPPMSAVEAELNRLAYLPDQEDDLGPGRGARDRLLRRAERGARAPPCAGAQPARELYAPRQSAAPVRHALHRHRGEGRLRRQRRRKRHVLRKIVTFVVLAGMVAGGLFAVKYFVLDKVKWTDDIAPLAVEVETARGLKFDHDVPVDRRSPATSTRPRIVEIGRTASPTRIGVPWRRAGGRWACSPGARHAGDRAAVRWSIRPRSTTRPTDAIYVCRVSTPRCARSPSIVRSPWRCSTSTSAGATASQRPRRPWQSARERSTTPMRWRSPSRLLDRWRSHRVADQLLLGLRDNSGGATARRRSRRTTAGRVPASPCGRTSMHSRRSNAICSRPTPR